MKRAYIPLTKDQRELLHPVFLECFRQGGSIMAQVFTDGMHVVLLPDDVAIEVSKATGAARLPINKGNNGFKAFSEGIERDKKGGAV